jgi:hypothetical protein
MAKLSIANSEFLGEVRMASFDGVRVASAGAALPAAAPAAGYPAPPSLRAAASRKGRRGPARRAPFGRLPA